MVFQLVKRRLAFHASGVLLLLAGCTIGAPEEIGQEIALPNEQYRLEEVLPDGQLLLAVRSEDKRWNNFDPEYALLSNGVLKPLSLPADPLCVTGTAYQQPATLPDGRLGFIKHCIRSLEAPVGQRGEFTLVAFDFRTGEVEQIVGESLYVEQGIVNHTWSNDITQGIASTGDLRGTFYWVYSDGPAPMTVTVGEGSQSWLLSDALIDLYEPNLPLKDWPPVGIASRPAWSPNGQTIAFVASPAATELEGRARANVPFNLYFMSPDDLQPEIVLEDIYNPFALEWSPDGESLLIDGCTGLLRRCGLWVYSLTNNDLGYVTAGEKFYAANWLSNNEIIASYCADQEELICSAYLLMQYDVSDTN